MLANGPRMAEVVDAAIVGDDAAVLPDVQGEARWLACNPQPVPVTQLENELEGRARRRGRGRSVPTYLHGTMDVTADNASDLWMPLDDCPERFTPAKAELVQHPDPGLKRRMVHEDDRRLGRCLHEHLLEPRRPRSVKGSPGIVLDRSV